MFESIMKAAMAAAGLTPEQVHGYIAELFGWTRSVEARLANIEAKLDALNMASQRNPNLDEAERITFNGR